MAYNYELCFWDPNDDGVNVLLEHISGGIKSCETMVSFFKQRSELEKDYSRRLGAISNKMLADMGNNPEYGHLNDCFNIVATNEKSRAQAHSKQSELIYRQIFGDIRAFASKLQARYSTLSGKTENLRLDKYNKRKGCEDLTKRLEEAQIRARDLQLNQNNIIGSKKIEHNRRELAKWESNSREISLQLDVLKQEYKASQKYWFKEWADITSQLQEMETARISFIQSKMQQYSEATIETYVLEQSKMDSLMNHMATFTPADDIADFSSSYGTGRLKEKRNQTAKRASSREALNSTNKRDSYVENIRKLSSQLQRQSFAALGESRKDKPLPHPQIQPQTQPVESYKPASRETIVIQHSPRERSERASPLHEHNQLSPASAYRPSGQSPKPHKPTSSSSSASSSIPTDFTTHVKNRHSMDSMATSVSSMASSIDESQRFAKSWNSSNRKRKSMSHLQQEARPGESLSPSLSDASHDNLPHNNSQLRNTSTNTTIVNPDIIAHRDVRRKSMALRDSENPIEDALYEMERIKSVGSNIFASSDARMGRVRDNGITVTLPIVTTAGEPVIKFAKAVYPLMDNEAAELAHFQKGDYLLLTASVNEDWYRGEVYDNDLVDKTHKNGLIPVNFIQLLS